MTIDGYWWLLVAILLMAIGDYCIINYYLIFYVIRSQAIDTYYIVGYLKLLFIGYYFLF